MRYYRLSPAIWHEAWDDDTRLLAFYVLTSPHRTTEGLFRLPLPYVQADTGWTPRRIEKGFAKLEEAGFLRRHADVVLVVNALKYQSPGNPNQGKAAAKALSEVPETPLDTEFAALAKRFSEHLWEALPERFTDALGESPSLALTPSQAPSPPPTGGGVDVDKLRKALLRGFEEPDVDGAMRLLELRLAAGEKISSPAAWTEAVVHSMAEKRKAAARADEPQRVVLADGSEMVHAQGRWWEADEWAKQEAGVS